METKRWWESKTLWANAIAFVALVIQSFGTGFALKPEDQLGILAVINIILRLITKTGISG